MAKTPKPEKTPKLTDAERHKRFVETAEKVGASEDRAEFDAAFEKVTKSKRSSTAPESPRAKP